MSLLMTARKPELLHKGEDRRSDMMMILMLHYYSFQQTSSAKPTSASWEHFWVCGVPTIHSDSCTNRKNSSKSFVGDESSAQTLSFRRGKFRENDTKKKRNRVSLPSLCSHTATQNKKIWYGGMVWYHGPFI